MRSEVRQILFGKILTEFEFLYYEGFWDMYLKSAMCYILRVITFNPDFDLRLKLSIEAKKFLKNFNNFKYINFIYLYFEEKN